MAAVRRGLVAGRATMVLDGGELEVAWAGEGPVRMTGPYAISSGSFDPATIGRFAERDRRHPAAAPTSSNPR
ncbi:MAG: hypothetical protein R3C69_06425 [Geminicoccaceae bacterium]